MPAVSSDLNFHPPAMAEKVTMMKLKVDLQNEKCRKKVKKVLCKFPQIRDQEFDEKKNIVTIKVVCCSPEKIRDKLCCKGCGCIKSIEIVEPRKPPPPKPEPKPEPPPPKPEPKPEPPPPKPEPKPEPPPPKPEPKPNPRTCCISCEEGRRDGPCFQGCGGPPTPSELPLVPIRTCCAPCSEGRDGGPCFQGYGGPSKPPEPIRTCCESCYQGRRGGPCFGGYGGPPPCYEGYFYARPVYDSYGGGRPCFVSHCDQYFSEENPSGCTVM